VKRLQRLGQYPEDVDLIIVSAKHGVIPHDLPIPAYDLRMSPERALKQAPENRTLLKRFLKGRCYSEVFISVGKDYSLALEPHDAWCGTASVIVNEGRIGLQLRGLKRWLLRVTK
jgi:hypothetical protein